MQRNQTRQNGNQGSSFSDNNQFDPDRDGRWSRDTGYRPGGYDRGLERDRDDFDRGSSRIDGSRGSDRGMQTGGLDDQDEQFYRDMGNHGLDTQSSGSSSGFGREYGGSRGYANRDTGSRIGMGDQQPGVGREHYQGWHRGNDDTGWSQDNRGYRGQNDRGGGDFFDQQMGSQERSEGWGNGDDRGSRTRLSNERQGRGGSWR